VKRWNRMRLPKYLKVFRDGFFHLTFLKANEYRAILLQLPFAMVSAGVENHLVKPVVTVLRWFLMLLKPQYSVSEGNRKNETNKNLEI